MSKIPTAEEFLIQKYGQGENSFTESEVKQSMIEFAKLHVKAALEEAAKDVCIDWDYFTARIDTLEGNSEKLINRQSIFNAYPPENIK